MLKFMSVKSKKFEKVYVERMTKADLIVYSSAYHTGSVFLV